MERTWKVKAKVVLMIGALRAVTPKVEVVGMNGPPERNLSSVLLLDCCTRHGLSIMNTMFRHKSVHTCTWHRDTLGRSSEFLLQLYRGRSV